MTYTPTTEQIRNGFAYDPVAEYHDPITNHTAHNRRAFDLWYVEEIRRAKNELIEEILGDFDSPHFYHYADGSEGHYLQAHHLKTVRDRLWTHMEES